MFYALFSLKFELLVLIENKVQPYCTSGSFEGNSALDMSRDFPGSWNNSSCESRGNSRIADETWGKSWGQGQQSGSQTFSENKGMPQGNYPDDCKGIPAYTPTCGSCHSYSNVALSYNSSDFCSSQPVRFSVPPPPDPPWTSFKPSLSQPAVLSVDSPITTRESTHSGAPVCHSHDLQTPYPQKFHDHASSNPYGPGLLSSIGHQSTSDNKSVASATGRQFCAVDQMVSLDRSHGNSSLTSVNHLGKVSDHRSVDNLLMEDHHWVNEWMKKVMLQPSPKGVTSPKPKVSDAQQAIADARKLTAMLRQLKEWMHLNLSSAGEAEWLRMRETCDCIVHQLQEKCRIFQDRLYTQIVRGKLPQRRKKRLRVRKRKHKAREERVLQRQKWKEKEELIDRWRESLLQQEKDKIEAEALKADASAVLGEVNSKQQDVDRMRQLLFTLQLLREARLKKGEAQGYISTPGKELHFKSTMGELEQMLEQQSKEYEAEKRTLEVMMVESKGEQMAKAGKKSEDFLFKRRAKFMEILLFGDMPPPCLETYRVFTAANESLESLLRRRYEWDQFVTSQDNPLGTAIPLGWVIPELEPRPDIENHHSIPRN